MVVHGYSRQFPSALFRSKAPISPMLKRRVRSFRRVYGLPGAIVGVAPLVPRPSSRLARCNCVHRLGARFPRGGVFLGRICSFCLSAYDLHNQSPKQTACRSINEVSNVSPKDGRQSSSAYRGAVD